MPRPATHAQPTDLRSAFTPLRSRSESSRFTTTPRTLQRRLAVEGTSYEALLDAARRDAATRYLANSTVAICEISYLLGYSEPAAFHRAFKRWHEETPHAFRARQGRHTAL